MMEGSRLRHLIFMALCCDLGLFAKKLVNPLANLITDQLHIPGGISTAFSLMFLVIAVAAVPKFGTATLMGAAQGLLALAMGRVGSMGLFSPIGYIVPGVVIDAAFLAGRGSGLTRAYCMVLANALGGMAASLTANLIVFRLQGVVLLLYLSVACTCGAICGYLGEIVASRAIPVIREGEIR